MRLKELRLGFLQYPHLRWSELYLQLSALISLIAFINSATRHNLLSVGGVLVVGALAIRIWARISRPPRSQQSLPNSGVYQYMQHPLWFATGMATVGLLVMSNQLVHLVLYLVIATVLLKFMAAEEVRMQNRSEHADFYALYRSRVSSFFPQLLAGVPEHRNKIDLQTLKKRFQYYLQHELLTDLSPLILFALHLADMIYRFKFATKIVIVSFLFLGLVYFFWRQRAWSK